ncbi:MULTISPECIES: cyclase family protein [Burkholderiaceae]|uniref:cyclase family protein n=1 Tax=Burkholderiaceae TaxID=119060 RepID=UPI00142284FC|nr:MULTISPECIES: cyclase family protein [Burkholderiaceae]MBN3847293.1 cyclase family protein [Paraburkholderia sp. Ac-20342]NIF51344.1 cyclase family protein [Burkholderia sp. Ax-1724]
MPPSYPDDIRGNWRYIGPDTWTRCAPFLSGGARCYDLAHPIDDTAPSSPFAQPLSFEFGSTQGIPGTLHAGNLETVTGSLGQQGTHIDALGHFGVLKDVWDGHGPLPADEVSYFGGLPQRVVKPDPHGRLARLGIDEVPPLLSTGILLDAAGYHGVDELPPGFEITEQDLTAMLARQDLLERGILPGDIVFIHTGWGRRWSDARYGAYYTSGPGLSAAGAAFLAASEPVVVGLDNPFTDPVNDGQLQGASAPPAGMRTDAPFGTHHFNLVEAGVLQIQNLKLDDLARDRVWLFAAIVVPLALRGASGSIVRPVAIGTPRPAARSR